MRPTAAKARRDNAGKQLGDAGVAAGTYYKEISLCPVCYSIYTMLDRGRAMLRQAAEASAGTAKPTIKTLKLRSTRDEAGDTTTLLESKDSGREESGRRKSVGKPASGSGVKGAPRPSVGGGARAKLSATGTDGGGDSSKAPTPSPIPPRGAGTPSVPPVTTEPKVGKASDGAKGLSATAGSVSLPSLHKPSAAATAPGKVSLPQRRRAFESTDRRDSPARAGPQAPVRAQSPPAPPRPSANQSTVSPVHSTMPPSVEDDSKSARSCDSEVCPPSPPLSPVTAVTCVLFVCVCACPCVRARVVAG